MKVCLTPLRLITLESLLVLIGLFTLCLTTGYHRSKTPLLTLGKGMFHTCNLVGGLAPFFSRGYETFVVPKLAV